MNLAAFAALCSNLQTAKDILDFARASILTSILDSIGDVHAATAARLIEEGARCSHAARREKYLLAVGHLEVAYEAYARREPNLALARRVVHGVLRTFFGWIMGPDDHPEFGRASELALLAAALYAALGDDVSARERLADARYMFGLYERAREKSVGWYGLADLVVTVGAVTEIERHIENDRETFEAATRDLSMLLAG